MTNRELDPEIEVEESPELRFPVIALGILVLLVVFATGYSFSLTKQTKAFKEQEATAAKDRDQGALLRCQLYANSGLEESKGRLLKHWQEKKSNPREWTFSRRLGSTFAGGHDELSVTLRQKDGVRYEIVSEGALYTGTQSRYSSQFPRGESRSSFKRASYKLVTEFDFKDGQISSESQVSGLGRIASP
jgi:hypothetical protein